MESLYRKYRPLTFADVVGQKHIVSTLENAVLEGKCSHAYLFCGPRGTGKTTMARIMAKALLCDMGEGHLPDGTCEQCEAIAAGEHPDVYELDAASRTGVDNVREVIDSASYAPVKGRAKVYIIDEVHMLTTQAFNALLKTLEEPPAHVTFIMCTTDPQMILDTILSRVQRFDFHAISSEDIKGRLLYVCDKEGYTYDEEAIDLVVRHARGGMRDALSMLEQLSVFGAGEIRLEDARDLLGSASASKLQGTTEALAKRDVVSLFEQVSTLVNEGQDLLQFTRDLSSHIRNVYIVSVAGDNYDLVDAIGSDMEVLQAQSKLFESCDRLARCLEVLGSAASTMRYATNQRLVLEVALTKLARPDSDLTLEALNERVIQLEKELSELKITGVGVQNTPVAQAAVSVSQPVATPAAAAKPVAPAPVQTAKPVAPTVAPAPKPVAPTPTVAPTPAAKPVAPVKPSVSPIPSVSPLGVAPGAPVATPKPQTPATTAPAVSMGGNRTATDPSTWSGLWGQVIRSVGKTYIQQMLEGTSVVNDDGEVLTVNIPPEQTFTYSMLQRKDTQQMLTPGIKQFFGSRSLDFVQTSAGGSTPSKPVVNTPVTPVSKPTPTSDVSPVVDNTYAQAPAYESVPVDAYEQEVAASSSQEEDVSVSYSVPENLTEKQEEIYNVVASQFGEGVKVVPSPTSENN